MRRRSVASSSDARTDGRFDSGPCRRTRGRRRTALTAPAKSWGCPIGSRCRRPSAIATRSASRRATSRNVDLSRKALTTADGRGTGARPRSTSRTSPASPPGQAERHERIGRRPDPGVKPRETRQERRRGTPSMPQPALAAPSCNSRSMSSSGRMSMPSRRTIRSTIVNCSTLIFPHLGLPSIVPIPPRGSHRQTRHRVGLVKDSQRGPDAVGIPLRPEGLAERRGRGAISPVSTPTASASDSRRASRRALRNSLVLIQSR